MAWPAFFLALLLASAALADPAIGRLNHAGYRHKQHCTAVLVTPTVALTAAHCLEDVDVTESHLLLGYDRGQWSEHLQPDGWQPLGHDLAALCLAGIARTRPLPLAAAGASRGEDLTAAGYGWPSVHLLQRTDCPVAALGADGLIGLACQLNHGTSGGPLLRRTAQGEEVVAIAVASGADQAIAVGIAAARAPGLCAAPQK